MDIRDQRDMNPGADLMDGKRSRLIGNRDTDNFTARINKFLNLFDRRFDVSGVGGGHGLDCHGRIATDLNPAQIDGFCLFSSDGRTQKNTLSLRVTPDPADAHTRKIDWRQIYNMKG